MARILHTLFPGRQPVADERLMWRLAQKGDAAAFQELHERWYRPIFRLGVRMLGDEQFGEDLTQDVFARVFQKCREFQTDRRFSTWLWRIALNRCGDLVRHRNRRPEVALENEHELVDSSNTPDSAVDKNEQHNAVRVALMELDEPFRAVVVLRHYEDLKFREIADVMEIPIGTVKSRMVEALNQLSRKLATTREVVNTVNKISNPKPVCI